MKPRLLLFVALLGGLAVLLDLPELLVPATPLAFLTGLQGQEVLRTFCVLFLTGLLLLPCILAMALDRHQMASPWLRHGVEAVALASIVIAGPDLLARGFRVGWGLGATRAALERQEQGLPPRPERQLPRLPPAAQRAVIALSLTGLAALLLARVRRQEARAQALQDQALRAKLAPHFIFNTLNTLKAQIEQDPHAASATTDRLAALFRQVVQVADQPTIPLKQELAFVEAYLGIEQARLGERLTVVMDIPEDLDDRPMPPLSLQVLVENAIKHGIAPFEQPGTVTIEAEAVPEGLRLNVSDTGFGSATQPGTGTALATLRQRLARPEDLGWERLPSGFKASLLWRKS